MKKYTKLSIVGLLTIIFITLSSKLSYAKKDIDYINEIVNISNGKIEESGLKISIPIGSENSIAISKEDEEKICVDILEEYKKYVKDSLDITVQKSEFKYCISFENNTVQGYIQNNSIDNLRILTFKVEFKIEKNQLLDIEPQISKIIKLAAEKNHLKIAENEMKKSCYVKAKLANTNISATNDEIIRYLKKQKAKNIDTVKIDNGFSTVAYTESYNRINKSNLGLSNKSNLGLSNNANFDLNYMINNYMHGSYLVVGIPVIDVDFEQ